jgi:hypothetical protein
LLKDVAIVRPNQVWAADITYLPMAQGFAYLVAILDVFSRKVLAYRVSNTMTTDFLVLSAVEALVLSAVEASAWTARVAGSTMCSSNGGGVRSSMRRSI